MRKAIFIIFMLVAAIATAVAAERSEGDALAIARQKAAALGIKMPQTSNGSARAKGIGTSNASPYYIFSGEEGKGFVVVAGDDRMGEVIAYSATSSLPDIESKEYEGTTLRLLFDGFRNMATALKAGDTEVEARAREAMQLTAEGNVAVEPILGDLYWNQRSPFNKFCPIAHNGMISNVGCVAIAYATVMKHWNHPKQLLADIPAYTTKSRGYEMEAVGAGCEYHWDKMRETYKEGEYSEEEADAVATLLSHVGRAFEMNYDKTDELGLIDGIPSGANQRYVKNFLRCFGYDEDTIDRLDFSSVPLPELKSRLISELVAGRPMVVSGNEIGGYGHAFVCDGVDSQGLLHVKLGVTNSVGEAGNSDFYCNILSLGSYIDTTGELVDGYYTNIDFIVGIQPDNGIKDEVQPRANYQIDLGEARLKSNEVTRESSDQPFVTEMVLCLRRKYDDGKYGTDSFAVAIKDADGNYEIISDTVSIEYNSESSDYEYIYPKINYLIPRGEHQTYLLSKTDGSDTWVEVEGCEMTMPAVFVTSKRMVLAELLVSANVDAVERKWNRLGLTISFENNDDKDFQRYVITSFYDASGKRLDGVVLNVYIPAHGKSRRFLPISDLGVDKATVVIGDFTQQYYFVGEVALPTETNIFHVLSNSMNISESLTDVDMPMGEVSLLTAYDDVINIDFAVMNGGKASTVCLEALVLDESTGETVRTIPIEREYGENEEGNIRITLDRNDLDLTGRMVSVTLKLVSGATKLQTVSDGGSTFMVIKALGLTLPGSSQSVIFYWAGSTTSIDSLSADGEAVEFYDLSGRRQATQGKGISIVRVKGRKTVKKINEK